MKTLNTRNLPDVANGLLAAAIDAALAKVHEDLDDRPSVDKDRVVTIKLKLRPAKLPKNEDNGSAVDRANSLEAARIQFEVNHTMPPQSFARSMRNVSGKSAFGFETDTNSIKFAPNQQTLPIHSDSDSDADDFNGDSDEDAE
jgi:hypothetical protein